MNYDYDVQCECIAPSSTLIAGRWICDECARDTDLYREDQMEVPC
jgi:hypothetical protein